jgi:endonuclease YncB( thermonuclease family)
MNINVLTMGAGLLAAATAAAALTASPAAAQGRWELLGTRSVAFLVDRDVVSGRGQGRFQTIRLCVANNAVQFREVEVVFANGERQQLPVNAFVRPGGCSANLDLRGEARRIDRVELVYNSVPNFRGRAMVSVYGLQTAMGPGPGPVGPGAWDRLGTRTVGFQVDRDTFDLEGEGRFRALRLCVSGNAVRFERVAIRYGNGDRQELPVRHFIRPGACTPALDIGDGRARRLRRVVMVYNTVPNFRGQAAVTLFGLR